MTLSVEAESLAKEALKAAEDARRAQQRLQMLKKRYGMMKNKSGGDDNTTTPTKPAIQTTKKDVISPPPPPSKTVVEVHKDNHHHHHEESSIDRTVETRGTGSVATNEKRVEDALALLGPPPPPPPKVIRAVSPRKEEELPPAAAPAPVEEETRQEVKTQAPVLEPETEEREPEMEMAQEPVVEPKPEVMQVIAEPPAPPAPVETAAEPQPVVVEPPMQQQEAPPAPVLQEEAPVETPKEEVPVLQESPIKVMEEKSVVPEPTPEPTPYPVVVQQQQERPAADTAVEPQTQMAQPKVFSFYEAQAAPLAVVQEGSEDSEHSREAEQPVPVQTTAPVQQPAPAVAQPMPMEPKQAEPQEAPQTMPAEPPTQPIVQQRRAGPPPASSSGSGAHSFQLPKPAYMEAEAMLGAMLNDPRLQQQQQFSPRHRSRQQQQPPVGKAMTEMAVSAPPASAHYHYSAPETLQPIDELQQRVAAIPETKDDVPAPLHYHEQHYGAYNHFGDDVSVLTEHFPYAKPLSPRHFNQEPIAEEQPAFREPPETRRPATEESSLYGDAPERDARFPSQQSVQGHQRGFGQAETPRFRNTASVVSPRSDPAGQLEPDQKDPRQPQMQDPPQINSRQFDHEAGRGMEPSEVKMQPLVSHLRNRAEPEGHGRHPHIPRPNRRVQLSVDPNSPRNPMEAPNEPVSPLSASGISTAPRHHHPQSRAAPLGYNTPYGGYASGGPIVSGMPQMQHRYITTRSGAASVASYHRAHYPGDATVMSHQPMMRAYSPMHRSSPVGFHSGASVASMPYQRTEFFHPHGNVSFHETHYVPSGGASVAASAAGETVISVRTNARGNKVVKKLVKVEEEDETDPVVAFCDMLNIDQVCGIEFDEQYKVVEEELPPEPLTAADVGRNAAMGKKVFNENNYTDPFAGRHNEAGLCGLL